MRIKTVPPLWGVVFGGLLFWLAAGPAGAANIEGYVDETNGRRVKILLAGSEIPEVGDLVKIHRETADGGASVVGTWEVECVERQVVWATALEGDAVAAPGMKALVHKNTDQPPAAGTAQDGVAASFKAVEESLGYGAPRGTRFDPARKGWLGVTLQMVTRDMAAAFGMPAPQGALVASVFSGGPAQRAGLRDDDVILNFNGMEITNCHVMPDLLAAMTPGSEVTMVLWRNGKMVTAQAVMGLHPSAAERAAAKGPSPKTVLKQTSGK